MDIKIQLIKIARMLKADEATYKHDPDHSHKPVGLEWKETKEGWSRKDPLENHPRNLMQQRKNDKKMTEIGKHYKKDPKDLTNAEIEKFNKGK